MNEPGTTIDDRYEIVSTLGVGGFGTVVKARQIQFDRFVAVKLLKTTMLEDPEGLPRFEREAKAINALKHKNIVGFYGYGVWLNAPYMVMEFIEGKSLEQMIIDGKLEPNRALKIIAQVFEALDFAHRHGVVHRDLKPSNIMIVTDSNGFEVVKIIDFGLARLMPSYGVPGQKLTETGYALGTCHYMAPEQARGLQVDQRADIYSAGCILQQALTAKLPFDAADNVAIMYKHLDEQSPPITQSLGESTQTSALQTLIDNCLAKKPEDRYSDGREAARDALSIAEERYDSIVRLNTKIRRKSQRSWAAKDATAALILTAVVSAGILCLFLLSTKGSTFKTTQSPSSSDLFAPLVRQLDNTLATRERLAPELENVLRLYAQDHALSAKAAYFFAEVLSDVHYQRSNFAKAEQYSKQALAENSRLDKSWINGRLIVSLATAQLAQQKTAAAMVTLEKSIAARSLLTRDGSQAAACYLSALLITAYIEEDELVKADQVAVWLRSHVDQAEFYKSLCQVSLGDLELAKGNYAAAQRHFQQSLKDTWAFDDWGWLGLARSELYQRHFDSAAKYAKNALESNRQSEPHDTTFPIASAYLILTAASAAAKEPAAAVEALVQKQSPSLSLSRPAKLNDRDISIASTELHNAGFDILADKLQMLPRSTLPPTGPGTIR